MQTENGDTFIGAHVSIGGGVEQAPLNAAEINARAFALFTKNQRQWKAPALTQESIELFKTNAVKNNYRPEYIFPHSSYLINLGNPEKEKRTTSLTTFIDEVRRVEALGLHFLIFHPGAHLGQMEETQCIQLIAENLNTTIRDTDAAILVIEITAGQGTAVGYKFEHLAEIIAKIEDPSRIGVCLDTAHMFAAGYEIRVRDSYETTMDTFNRTIGFEYLRGVHLNDSKKDLASRVDRHASIGEGYLGLSPFEYIVNDSRFDNMPLIIETPDKKLWAQEIRLLYSLQKT
jgi:deoxyribonuclease-4